MPLLSSPMLLRVFNVIDACLLTPPPPPRARSLAYGALGEASAMPESNSKNDGTEHEGQLVAGSGTAEGYSREGSDVGGRLDQLADPSRGAKASTPSPYKWSSLWWSDKSCWGKFLI